MLRLESTIKDANTAFNKVSPEHQANTKLTPLDRVIIASRPGRTTKQGVKHTYSTMNVYHVRQWLRQHNISYTNLQIHTAGTILEGWESDPTKLTRYRLARLCCYTDNEDGSKSLYIYPTGDCSLKLMATLPKGIKPFNASVLSQEIYTLRPTRDIIHDTERRREYQREYIKRPEQQEKRREYSLKYYHKHKAEHRAEKAAANHEYIFKTKILPPSLSIVKDAFDDSISDTRAANIVRTVYKLFESQKEHEWRAHDYYMGTVDLRQRVLRVLASACAHFSGGNEEVKTELEAARALIQRVSDFRDIATYLARREPRRKARAWVAQILSNDDTVMQLSAL